MDGIILKTWILWRFSRILPVIAVGALLVFIALIDLYRNRKTRKNVLVWTLIIIFVNVLGPILYFVIGRKDGEKL